MIFDFFQKGRERYGYRNRYQKLCQSQVRERLSFLRREHPDYIFDIDDSGQYIEAYQKIDLKQIQSVAQT